MFVLGDFLHFASQGFLALFFVVSSFVLCSLTTSLLKSLNDNPGEWQIKTLAKKNSLQATNSYYKREMKIMLLELE